MKGEKRETYHISRRERGRVSCDEILREMSFWYGLRGSCAARVRIRRVTDPHK